MIKYEIFSFAFLDKGHEFRSDLSQNYKKKTDINFW